MHSLSNAQIETTGTQVRRKPIRRAARLALLGLLALPVLTGCGQRDPGLGERIYQRGEGVSGRLTYRLGPAWLARGGACATCHGRRGEGLSVRAGDVTGSAPALTAAALAARGYDAARLRAAITRGIAPDGREFHYYMPRWDLSDTESRALLRYLADL